MAKEDFVPGKQLERKENGEEFVTQLKVDGADFGITTEEVDDAEAAIQDFGEQVDKGISINAAKQEQTKVTRASDWTFVNIWRKITRKIKVNDKYTDAVGERYKIVGDESSFNPQEAKPELKTKKVPNGWEFRFNLMGYFDGIRLYRKSTDEADFKYLATDTRSPYVETDKIGSGTQYYAYFFEGDEMIGQRSDIVTIEV